MFYPLCPSFNIESFSFEKVLLRVHGCTHLSSAAMVRQVKLDSIRSTRRHRRLPVAIWNPRQIATKHVDGQGRCHENCAYPEAPVTMHAPPIWTRIGFSPVATISFQAVLASCHFVSITAEYSPRRAA